MASPLEQIGKPMNPNHLGDFGVDRPEIIQVFGYFGTNLRVNPDLTDLVALEAFKALSNVSDEDPTELVGAVDRLLSTLLHPEDVDVCLRLAREHRQTIEDLAALAGAILGALAQRPTRLPSGSSPSGQNIEPSSTDGSFSPAELSLVKDMPPGLAADVVRLSRTA